TFSRYYYTFGIKSPISELVSIPSGFSTQAVEKDINEIIQQCKSLGRHMEEKRGGFFCQSESEKPWLNDMIGKANQILNALLRLRKQQLAMNNNTLALYNDLTHSDPKKRTKYNGQCQSCDTLETPEWRRGPNGARTLCNACGL
ncbi:hypothetical protein CU098_008782, partial [Rhizopus stolonifer]